MSCKPSSVLTLHCQSVGWQCSHWTDCHVKPAWHAAVDIHRGVDTAPPASPQTDLHATAPHSIIQYCTRSRCIHFICASLLLLAGWSITTIITGSAESAEVCSLFHLRQWNHVMSATTSSQFRFMCSLSCACLCMISSGDNVQHTCLKVTSMFTWAGPQLTSTTDYITTRPQSKYGKCTFSHAALAAWNKLPENINHQPRMTIFRKPLFTECL